MGRYRFVFLGYIVFGFFFCSVVLLFVVYGRSNYRRAWIELVFFFSVFSFFSFDLCLVLIVLYSRGCFKGF